jgi:hypothetical protein
MNHYTSLDASADPLPSRRVLARRLYYRPIRHFFYLYFQRRGFLDGEEGFLWSAYMAIELFFILAKQWERALPEPQRYGWRRDPPPASTILPASRPAPAPPA